MSRSPYSRAMDRALATTGFERSGRDWVRIRGELEERVDIQPGVRGGRTVNLTIKNLGTEKLYVEVFAYRGVTHMPGISERLGILVDNYDRWWRDEPNGPEEMAELTILCGLPWFDRFQTLEDQAANWYGRFAKMRGYHGPSLIGLALTLVRMGEREEACAALNKPVPRTAIQSAVEDVARVRDWLGCSRPEVA